MTTSNSKLVSDEVPHQKLWPFQHTQKLFMAYWHQADVMVHLKTKENGYCRKSFILNQGLFKHLCYWTIVEYADLHVNT